MDNTQKEIKHDLLKICWYMRGSITWEEAWSLSDVDRNDMIKYVGENAERFKKSGQVVV